MPRIQPIEPDQASPAVAALYEQLRTELGIEPNNFFKTIGHHPDLLKPMIELSRVMLEGGLLERRLKEWVILQVARQHHCAYVYEAHKYALSRALMSEVIDDRRQPIDTSSFSEADQLAIRYAHQIGAGEVEDATVAALRAHFNEAELVELTLLASYYIFICRTIAALGVEMDALKYLSSHPHHG